MSLERREATQIVSCDPPLPVRAFPVKQYGSTTDSDTWGGSGTDGRRYGRFRLDTTVWTRASTQANTPMVPGEKFQIWTTISSGSFPGASDIGTYGSAANAATASPDLLKIDNQINGDPSTKPVIQLKGGQASDRFTVVGVVQAGNNLWDVYFSPFMDDVAISTTQDGIVTVPEPRNGVWFGQLGHVNGVTYNWSKPGGPTQMTWKLLRPPTWRHAAMNPGRTVQAFRGGSCIWEGILMEPQPDSTGWTLTANGAGTYGSNFSAIYDTWTADNPVNKAVGRGMRWKNYGIGKPTGIFLGQAQDSGSMTVTDFLNLLCTGGALYWSIDPPKGATMPSGPWELKIKQFPTDIMGSPLAAGVKTPEQWNVQEWQRIDLKQKLHKIPPDLYLVNTNVVPRTITNDYNSLTIKYQATADKTATSTAKAEAATYGIVVVDNPASVAVHGRNEYYIDMSTSQTMTEAAVISVGQNVLRNYARANFSNGMTVQPGRLLNNGGVPVDIGLDWSGKVVALQVEDSAFGGEVSYGPVNVLIGDYAYDDDSQTATITPYQNQKTDISSIISMLYPGKFT